MGAGNHQEALHGQEPLWVPVQTMPKVLNVSFLLGTLIMTCTRKTRNMPNQPVFSLDRSKLLHLLDMTHYKFREIMGVGFFYISVMGLSEYKKGKILNMLQSP